MDFLVDEESVGSRQSSIDAVTTEQSVKVEEYPVNGQDGSRTEKDDGEMSSTINMEKVEEETKYSAPSSNLPVPTSSEPMNNGSSLKQEVKDEPLPLNTEEMGTAHAVEMNDAEEEKKSSETSHFVAPVSNPVNDQDETPVRKNSIAKRAREESGATSNPEGLAELKVALDGERTATPCNTDTTAPSYAKLSHSGAPSTHPGAGTGSAAFATIYGRPVPVTDAGGSFPQAGSVLGPFFCLGQLGKGTFSSIHKCINMEYYHTNLLPSPPKDPPHAAAVTDASTGKDKQYNVDLMNRRRRRLAAAKVELGSFQQSGVLEAEAMILEFLDRNVPAGTVPTYMGHYRSEKFAAILMEYLVGEDMHQMRERVMASSTNESSSTRRISVDDAVYFTADVMLPLLEHMHRVGVVHRDVKPSNCVRQSKTSRSFCIVDFGLSKSIVVPEDSEFANREQPWPADKEWLKPLNYKGKGGYYRTERVKAEFRGTSMYASLRVHQEKDYCPRDDVWSLLYVFCDLVSGGLPWMSHAANRNRAECRRLKEWVHGDHGATGDGAINEEDHTAELLKGDAYHVAKYRLDRHRDDRSDPSNRPTLPEPLDMSTNETLVDNLRQAFKHLSTLQFWGIPDYDLIRRSIRCFREERNFSKDPRIAPVNWNESKPPGLSPDFRKQDRGHKVPRWEPIEEDDVDGILESDIFDDAESETKTSGQTDDFWSRLPLPLRHQIAQMEYNKRMAKDGTVPPHRALQDWMTVILPLLYDEWDAKKYEDGGHRTSTDGFKRMHYLDLLRRCQACAETFDNFQQYGCYYEGDFHEEPSIAIASTADSTPARKRRKVLVHAGSGRAKTGDLVFVSRALVGLRQAIKAEMAKRAPPPVRISFG